MFTGSGSRSTANTDSATMSQADRRRFNAEHPNRLGEKHVNTVQNIQDLQEIEKYMFNNLQSLNRSDPTSGVEAAAIRTRLNELKNMRMGLFGQLKTMYGDAQEKASHSRANLADQITMKKIVNNQVKNARNELKSLKQEKLNKKRLVELGEYEFDRYTSHKNLMKVITYGALGVLILVVLMGYDWFPAVLGFGGIVLIIVIVIITIIRRMLTNLTRTKLNWNKFDFAGYRGSGGGGEKKSFDFGALFRNTCDNIEQSFSDAQRSVLGSEASAKLRATVETTDGFQTMVNPSEPKNAEHFYNIF